MCLTVYVGNGDSLSFVVGLKGNFNHNCDIFFQTHLVKMY